jgi:hypothetical protein
MKSTRLCLACGNAFVALLHVPPRRYCSSKACQCTLRRDSQNNRLCNDSRYRENHACDDSGVGVWLKVIRSARWPGHSSPDVDAL